jgi:hypothetical protein
MKTPARPKRHCAVTMVCLAVAAAGCGSGEPDPVSSVSAAPADPAGTAVGSDTTARAESPSTPSPAATVPEPIHPEIPATLPELGVCSTALDFGNAILAAWEPVKSHADAAALRRIPQCGTVVDAPRGFAEVPLPDNLGPLECAQTDSSPRGSPQYPRFHCTARGDNGVVAVSVDSARPTPENTLAVTSVGVLPNGGVCPTPDEAAATIVEHLSRGAVLELFGICYGRTALEALNSMGPQTEVTGACHTYPGSTRTELWCPTLDPETGVTGYMYFAYGPFYGLISFDRQPLMEMDL